MVVSTGLHGSKKLIRKRGIETFFKLQNARVGDRVVVGARGPYHYRVGLERQMSMAS